MNNANRTYINAEARHIKSLSLNGSDQIFIEIPIPIFLGEAAPRINRSDAVNNPITPQAFSDLATYVEKLLGAHLDAHVARYDRAIASGNTNYIPHRLAYLYKRMITSVKSLEESPYSGDIVALLELTLFRNLVENFKTGPVWKQIRPELNARGSFVHMLCLLTFVNHLRMKGFHSILVASNENQRKIADAAYFTPRLDRIDVEVKCPELLWAPKNINIELATKVINNSWRKAKGQIGTGISELVIGGIFIPKQSLNNLVDSATKFFDRKKNTQVSSIIIMSVTVLINSPVIDGKRLVIGQHTSACPQHVMRRVSNPYYEGIVKFLETDSGSDNIDSTTEEVTEFRIE